MFENNTKFSQICLNFNHLKVLFFNANTCINISCPIIQGRMLNIFLYFKVDFLKIIKGNKTTVRSKTNTTDYLRLLKMECPFVIIITKRYQTCLAAIPFQIASIYLFPKYAPYWEWEHFLGLKTGKSSIHFTWWPFSAPKSAPIPNMGHI